MIDHFGMDRRALLQRALMLTGAAMLPGGAQALAAAAKSGKRTLSPARYAVLTALADTIVPKTDTAGALDAEVPARFDALVGVWANPEHKAEIIGAIDKIDSEARAKQGKGFAALSPAERATFLTPYDIAALKTPPAGPPPAPAAPSTLSVGKTATTVDPNYGKPKQEAAVPITRQMAPRVTDPGYSRVKELIVVLYYISELALTQELTYEHAPGEWQPSVPLTPTTRPSGGIAPI
jgi:hypothetical protein